MTAGDEGGSATGVSPSKFTVSPSSRTSRSSTSQPSGKSI